MGRDYPYFALPEPLPEHFVLTILGRAVPLNKESLTNPIATKVRPPFTTAPESPPEGVVSDDDTKDTARNIAANNQSGTTLNTLNNGVVYERPEWQRQLYPPQAVVCHDVQVLKENAFDHKTKLVVDKLLKAYGQYTATGHLNFSAKSFRRISMTTPQDQMQALLDERKQDTYNPEYARPVLELLNQHKELALVTSILTCSDMSKQAGNRRKVAGGVGGGVPEGAAAPPIHGETNTTLTTTERLEGVYEGEVVIACSYHKLVWRSEESANPNRVVRAARTVAGWFGKGYPREDDKIVPRARVPFVSPEVVGMVYLSKVGGGTVPHIFGQGGGGASKKRPENLNFTILS